MVLSQRIPLEFDEKVGSWILKRELPVSAVLNLFVLVEPSPTSIIKKSREYYLLSDPMFNLRRQHVHSSPAFAVKLICLGYVNVSLL